MSSKEYHQQYHKEYCQKRKQYYADKNKRLRLANREWFEKFLKDKCCKICGESDQSTFDSHHLDPKQKDYSVGELKSSTVGLKTIQEELNKCVLLCSNCHRKIHAGSLVLP